MTPSRPLLTLALSLVTGCFYSIEKRCEEVKHTGIEARGDLVAVESEASAAAMPEYPRARFVTTNGLEREVVPVQDQFRHDGDTLLVPLGIVSLRFARPEGRGATTLAALGATLCEWHPRTAPTCRSVDGDVVVTEMTNPCPGDGACEAIDLTIHVDEPDPLPPETVVHGTARLLYREWKETECRMVHEGSDSAFAVEH